MDTTLVHSGLYSCVNNRCNKYECRYEDSGKQYNNGCRMETGAMPNRCRKAAERHRNITGTTAGPTTRTAVNDELTDAGWKPERRGKINTEQCDQR